MNSRTFDFFPSHWIDDYSLGGTDSELNVLKFNFQTDKLHEILNFSAAFPERDPDDYVVKIINKAYIAIKLKPSNNNSLRDSLLVYRFCGQDQNSFALPKQMLLPNNCYDPVLAYNLVAQDKTNLQIVKLVSDDEALLSFDQTRFLGVINKAGTLTFILRAGRDDCERYLPSNLTVICLPSEKFFRSSSRNVLIGIRVNHTEEKKYLAVDKAGEALVELIDKWGITKLPHEILDSSNDGSAAIVKVWGKDKLSIKFIHSTRGMWEIYSKPVWTSGFYNAFLNTDQDPLRLTHFEPVERTGKYVLAVHGGPGGLAEDQPENYIQVWNSAGWHYTSVNYRGSEHENKNWIDSGKEYEGFRRMVKDVNAAIASVRDIGGEGADVIVWGSSFGGYLAACAIAESKNVSNVTGLVADSTFRNLSEFNDSFKTRRENRDIKYLKNTEIYFPEGYNENCLETATNDVPVFQLHNMYDPLVPHKLALPEENSKIEFLTINGALHAPQGIQQLAVISRILNYFDVEYDTSTN